jgi:hypothetical protein
MVEELVVLAASWNTRRGNIQKVAAAVKASLDLM